MSAAPTLTWQQYQKLPPDKRSRPLTDAEFAALTKQQRIAAGLDEDDSGAPANFNGPVFPNPDHVRPQLDSENNVPVTRLPNGVSFQKGNFSGAPPMDVSNPPATDVIPAMGREVGAQMSAQPVTLDMSTAQPIAAPVKLDMSTAQPIGSTAVSQQLQPYDPAKFGRYTTKENYPVWASTPPKAGPYTPPGEYEAWTGAHLSPTQTLEESARGPAMAAATVAPMLTGGASLPVQIAVGAGSGAAQTKLQGGSNTQAGVAGAVGGALPAFGAVAEQAAPYAKPIAKATWNTIDHATFDRLSAIWNEWKNVPEEIKANIAAKTPPVYPGANLPEHPGTFPGASEPTATPEQINPALVSEARSLPGQIGPERIYGPNPTPAQAIPPREGLQLTGEVAPSNQPTPQPAATAPKVSPAVVQQQLNDALGGRPLKPGVSLKNQPAAQGVKLPDGFTPVDSTMLKGYKYDPASQEFDAVLNDGQRYRHAGVTPDQVAAFEDANSKGAAYNKAIRNGPGVTPLGKVDANGTLIPRVKPSYRSATPEDVAPGETASQPAQTPSATTAKPEEDLTAPLQQMLDEVVGKKKAAASAGADTSSSSLLNRLMKGEAGQAGAPGSVTDADEGIADIQNRPVLNTLTREIPARGYLNGIGADENSVLKTQGDLDSVFYHRQQIAKNGTPNVELHVDEGNNIIGANGRHRALAAIQQGGPNAKVNLTIFRHPDPTP